VIWGEGGPIPREFGVILAEIRANSREERANSREDRANSREIRAISREVRAISSKIRAIFRADGADPRAHATLGRERNARWANGFRPCHRPVTLRPAVADL
jgi:hypothetical protein